MKTNEDIAKRVAELQAKSEERVLLTLDAHMAELETLREMAKKNGQIAAATTAEVKRGELMGYYIERRENTNTVYTITDKPLSQDEWEAKYCLGTPAGAASRPN